MVSKVVKLSDLTGNEGDSLTSKVCHSWTKLHTDKLCISGPCKGERLFVGRLIPHQIAGDEIWNGCSLENGVPMVPKAKEKFRNRVEAPILDFFKDPAHKDNTTTLTVVVQYSSNSTGRAVGFTVLNDILPGYSMYIPNV
ncbi:hypothetical protein GE061_010579 [Apolygus lucorum]|uniref:Uncharacterized protein n=1 Tax=Apolygus lucorum TaxID=248454 RepID=A0A6A4K608_APOLU|nr:hypothetical protein GE061_010579 [Apolygus lucorum]